jgi:hypothetical protein
VLPLAIAFSPSGRISSLTTRGFGVVATMDTVVCGTFGWMCFTSVNNNPFVRGERFRGSTGETNATRASKIAGLKLATTLEGCDPLHRKIPTLREFSPRFLEWVKTARLEFETQRYYRNGWRLLEGSRIVGMRLDRITVDAVEAMRFSGSPANANNALRTLRRMLNKAKEAKLIREVPEFSLFKEQGRAFRLDDEAERKLLPVAEQPLKDIIIVMRDTGMRNVRELYRMRIENINWHDRLIFNPSSKTAKGRRFGALLRSTRFRFVRAQQDGELEGRYGHNGPC